MITMQAFKAAALEAVREYFASSDAAEVARRLEELNEPGLPNIMVKLVQRPPQRRPPSVCSPGSCAGDSVQHVCSANSLDGEAWLCWFAGVKQCTGAISRCARLCGKRSKLQASPQQQGKATVHAVNGLPHSSVCYFSLV